MRKTTLLIIALILLVGVTGCDNETINNDMASPVLSTTQNGATSTSIPVFTDETLDSPFSTISPDESMRLDWTTAENSATDGKLKLIECESEKIIIEHDYPSDTSFLAIWSDDSNYCAIGYKNITESRTAIFITAPESPTVGQAIYSGDIYTFTQSIHSQDVDEHIYPIEFIDNSTLLLAIDWVDVKGVKTTYTTLWDFEHGTYTELEDGEN